MVVIVPDDLATFEAGLTADSLQTVLHSLGTANLTLALPKFTYDAPLSLAETLKALGMVDAFGPAADFSGIGARDLAITGVLHKGSTASTRCRHRGSGRDRGWWSGPTPSPRRTR